MKRLRMLSIGLFLLGCYGAALAQSDWPMFGHNPSNTAHNPSETTISTANVNQLLPKWTFTTGGDVSARVA